MAENEPRKPLAQPGREDEAWAALAIVDEFMRLLSRGTFGRLVRSLVRSVGRPKVEPNHEEGARRRAEREFHQLATNTVRFSVWTLLCGAAGTGVGLALSAGHRLDAQVMITVLAALVGGGSAFALPFVWLWLTAPAVQRSEARAEVLAESARGRAALEREAQRFAEMDQSHRDAFDRKWSETEDLRGKLGNAEARISELEATGAMDAQARLAAAKLQFGTELRDIRHKIEIVRSTRPHPHYSEGFRLPAFRWDEYDELVAVQDAALYAVLEYAYVAAHHVNSALDMRRTRAGPGVTIGVIDEDGLDAAYHAAGEALDALGEERGEVWESQAGGNESAG